MNRLKYEEKRMKEFKEEVVCMYRKIREKKRCIMGKSKSCHLYF
jgi:hypothetical protein